MKFKKNNYIFFSQDLQGIRASCLFFFFPIFFFLLMMSYKQAMTAQRNPTIFTGSGNSETTLPHPTIPLTPVSADYYSQNSAPYLTVTKLNGHNYLKWAQSVKLAIDGRGEIGNLIGEISKLVAGDSNMKKWQFENSLIIASLINSMGPAIRNPHLFLPTAQVSGRLLEIFIWTWRILLKFFR